ncbi:MULTISPECIES: hypothetical protein [unclassified Aminobacter]|uniref:hypothetical protein n=1 Tax=unclassified Aminobacter TaxID=2644704 RepID=UPI000467D0FD|nr:MULTISPECIES: hypothetical protein [unclassified Aminobacter]
MKQSLLVRQIFAELRAALGPEVPTKEVARLTATIMRAYKAAQDGFPDDYGEHDESRALHYMPVDQAFRQGWRLVRLERETFDSRDDFDPVRFSAIRPVITKYLGSEWLQKKQEGQL